MTPGRSRPPTTDPERPCHSTRAGPARRALYEQSREVGVAAWKPVLVGLVALIAVLVVAGRFITAVGPLDRADLDLLERIVERRTGWLDRPSDLATYLAETLPVLVLTALVAYLHVPGVAAHGGTAVRHRRRVG